jgi:hypothetical protein
MLHRKRHTQRRKSALRFSIEGFAAVGIVAALMFVAPFAASGNSAGNPISQKQKKESKKDQKKDNASAPVSLQGLPITDLSESEAILHALNRLTYGPRPGDVETVRQIGLAKWIDQQLNPDSINDSAMQARLEKYPTLRMSSAKLYSEFPQPQVAARKEGVSVEEYRKEQHRDGKRRTEGRLRGRFNGRRS